MFKDLSFRSYKISFCSWISIASSFKKTEVKLELSTDVDMLLMVEKGVTAGTVCVIHQYAKANDSYIDESSYLKYWDGNNLYGWAMSQKLPVINFESIEDTSQIEDL